MNTVPDTDMEPTRILFVDTTEGHTFLSVSTLQELEEAGRYRQMQVGVGVCCCCCFSCRQRATVPCQRQPQCQKCGFVVAHAHLVRKTASSFSAPTGALSLPRVLWCSRAWTALSPRQRFTKCELLPPVLFGEKTRCQPKVCRFERGFTRTSNTWMRCNIHDVD